MGQFSGMADQDFNSGKDSLDRPLQRQHGSEEGWVSYVFNLHESKTAIMTKAGEIYTAAKRELKPVEEVGKSLHKQTAELYDLDDKDVKYGGSVKVSHNLFSELGWDLSTPDRISFNSAFPLDSTVTDAKVS